MLLTLLACGITASSVCESGRTAAAACEDAFAMPDTCAGGYAGCNQEDLAAWTAYYDCYADACASGTAYGEDETCAAELDALSSGCSPGGADY